jgi:hypothetical protein
MHLKEHSDNNSLFRTFLNGQALSYVEYHMRRWLEAEDLELPDNDLIEFLREHKSLEFNPKHAIRVKKN